jgi:hypothetical protein
MNIFEQASRQSLRFVTPRGLQSTEDLWNIPLQSSNGFDLDNLAKAHNKELKAATDESFVVTTEHPMKAELTLKMELIKHVISVKLVERQAAINASAIAEKRQKLLIALQNKQNQELEGLSQEEIQQQLDALS